MLLILFLHRMAQRNPGTSCEPMTGKTHFTFGQKQWAILLCYVCTDIHTHTHMHNAMVQLAGKLSKPFFSVLTHKTSSEWVRNIDVE